MDLEIQFLDLRYEALRTRATTRERRLLAAIGDVGQQTPIIVVRDGEVWVVVDGYKRVRALRRLGHDTVRATVWDLGEADALVLERVLRNGDGDSAIEQGWLLSELSTRFALGRDELARRFDRTASWVSRRLALVRELPASVQTHVRAGHIGSHAAMKYLVPLARANSAHCALLSDAVAPARPTSRQMAELYAAYVGGNAAVRERIVRDPKLALRARAEAKREGVDKTPIAHLLGDVRIVSTVARRAHGRLARGAADGVSDDEREDVRRECREAEAAVKELTLRAEKELSHAG